MIFLKQFNILSICILIKLFNALLSCYELRILIIRYYKIYIVVC